MNFEPKSKEIKNKCPFCGQSDPEVRHPFQKRNPVGSHQFEYEKQMNAQPAFSTHVNRLDFLLVLTLQ